MKVTGFGIITAINDNREYENEEISLCGLSDKQFHIIFPQLKKIEEHLKKEGRV